MRALIQRVQKGAVQIDGEEVAAIGVGLVVFIGVGADDKPADAEYLANKIANLRIFADEQRPLNRSILDVGGEALVVSQFTLYGDTRRGRRPSFSQAAPPDEAQPLYELFVQHLRQLGVPTVTGRFQADMLVAIANDGPVTLMVESPVDR